MSIFSEQFEEEIANLNRLLDDSHLTTSALLQLLRDHNVPVGSPELIKAREKVEAEIQTLRTANAGLVERIKELEVARTRAAANSLANMLSYEELEAKVAKLERQNTLMRGIIRRLRGLDRAKGQP